jgi:hypothetical protein
MGIRVLNPVHAGQVWRDRDKRMLSGNRKVYIDRIVGDGDQVMVYYRPADWHHQPIGKQMYKSRYERFQRAFDLVG